MKILKGILVLIAIGGLILGGQLVLSSEPNERDEYVALRNMVMDFEHLSYDYNLQYEFEEGRKEKLEGHLSLSNGVLLDRNKETLSFRTDHWVYKAIHDNKHVMLANLDRIRTRLGVAQAANDKVPSKEPQKVDTIRVNGEDTVRTKGIAKADDISVDKGMFRYFIPDSVLFKYGKISLSKHPNWTEFKISFGDEIQLDSLIVRYNPQKKTIEYMKCVYDQPLGYSVEKDRDEYAKASFVATHFKTDVDAMPRFDIADYFTEKQGKVQLKQYKKYKLITLN